MKIISRNGNEKFVKEVLTLEKLFSWKMLGVFFTFSYCPALGLRVQKNPSSNVALGKKFVNIYGSAPGVYRAVYGKFNRFTSSSFN